MEHTDFVKSFLLEESILSEKELTDILISSDFTGKSLVSLLKSRNLFNRDQLTKLTAKLNNIEFVDLTSDMIDQMAVRLVPFKTARQHSLIPVRIEEDVLYVAMSSPMNLAVRDAISTRTGYKVVPLAATAEAIKQALAYYFNVENVTRQDIVSMRLQQSRGEDAPRVKKLNSAKVADAPIVRLVDSIVTGAIESRASDIHIEPHEPDMRVRYRIDGLLVEALRIPSTAQIEVISHIKILAEMDMSEKRISQDGHICIIHEEKEYDLRVSTLPASGGEKVVIRILDTSTGLLSLDKIATTKENFDQLNSLIQNPYGMVLLTGPTGSGKTTTLYSMIQALNIPERNIVTVEDPVEYRLNGITQVQVKSSIGMSFASSLRSILRQDPDVILVGEIRDYETAEIAISAALTGHLVLSTLHTNDAVGAVSRLISLGIPPFQVASSLLGTVAQRLVRIICQYCKTEYTPSPEDIDLIESRQHNNMKFYKSKGCDKCRNKGYYGRQGVYEIFNVTSEIKKLIATGKSDNKIQELAIQQGMKTLRTEGLEQVRRGLTSLEELFRVVDMR